MKLALMLALALLATSCTVDVCTTSIIGPTGKFGPAQTHCEHTRVP